MRWLALASLLVVALGCGGLVDDSAAPVHADGGTDARRAPSTVLRTPVRPPRHTLHPPATDAADRP